MLFKQTKIKQMWAKSKTFKSAHGREFFQECSQERGQGKTDYKSRYKLVDSRKKVICVIIKMCNFPVRLDSVTCFRPFYVEDVGLEFLGLFLLKLFWRNILGVHFGVVFRRHIFGIVLFLGAIQLLLLLFCDSTFVILTVVITITCNCLICNCLI